MRITGTFLPGANFAIRVARVTPRIAEFAGATSKGRHRRLDLVEAAVRSDRPLELADSSI
jgi:hypothetical protein